MNILAKSEGLSDRDVFTMTEDAAKFDNNVGRKMDILEYVLYEDADKKTGEMRELLAIKTDDGDVLGTNSHTIIGTFKRAISTLGFPIKNVEIVKKLNPKTEREFLNIKLV